MLQSTYESLAPPFHRPTKCGSFNWFSTLGPSCCWYVNRLLPPLLHPATSQVGMSFRVLAQLLRFILESGWMLLTLLWQLVKKDTFPGQERACIHSSSMTFKSPICLLKMKLLPLQIIVWYWKMLTPAQEKLLGLKLIWEFSLCHILALWSWVYLPF